MYQPSPNISLQRDTAVERTLVYYLESGYLFPFEKPAIGGLVLEGCFRSLERCEKSTSMYIASPQTLNKTKLHDKFVAHINELAVSKN